MSFWTNFRDTIVEPWRIPKAVERMQGSKTMPADAAMPYLEQAKDIYSPYMQQGQDAFGQLNPMYQQMASDPASQLQKLMSGYEESPFYANQREQALKAAGATAAAGGRRGTPQDMEQQANIAAALTGQGMQDWLRNVMGIKQSGMSGLSDIYGKGYGASSDIANILGTQGSLQFMNQAEKNKRQQEMMQTLMSLLGAAGGAAVGGFPGASFGSSVGGQIGGLLG